MSNSLKPFLGLDENGEVRCYVSPYPLNKLSDMHARGKPFPDEFHDMQSGKLGSFTAQVFLRQMEEYYRPESSVPDPSKVKTGVTMKRAIIRKKK